MKSTAVNSVQKLAVIAMILLAPLAANAEFGNWYTSGSIVYTDDDPDRKIDDGVSGVQFNTGRYFGRNLAFEGLLAYSKIDGFYLVTPPDTYVRDSETQLDLGANVLAFYNRDARFAPYALAGIGFHNADLNIGGSESNPTASLGAGFMLRFGDSPWSLRTEFRLRKAFDSGDRDFDDIIGIVGLQYTFGRGGEDTRAMPPADDAPAATPDDADRDEAPVVPADADGDGVPDSRDACANTAPGVAVDAAGCEEIRLETVYFDTESAALDATAKRKLDDAAVVLARNPDVPVEIAGHADSRGPEDYNMRLSVNRAEAVRRYLAQQGIDVARMAVRGFGESQPAASNDSREGQAMNRRAELRAMGREAQ